MMYVASVHVSQGEIADHASVLAVMHAAFATTRETPYPSSALKLTLADLAETQTLVARGEDAQVLGAVTWALRGQAVSFSRLAVEPSRQGQGIGSAMVEAIEHMARRVGAARVECTARSIYPDNRSFYARRGYVVVGYSGRYGVPDIRTHLTLPLG
ncbi:MAG: GNAT family N-acetyltransferase [Bradymonadia bacterium]